MTPPPTPTSAAPSCSSCSPATTTTTRLIAGDLNATSQSCVLQAAIDHGMALGAAKQRPWDTCNANRRPRKLDYLLYTRGHLDPRADALPPLRRDTPMPSLVEPSDHLPLRIRFDLVAAS